MAANTGHIELERTIDSIVVGSRHRTELGDIDALAASIERDGLLQPPTVTPEGVLVCGARRLAALRQLGYKKVNVFVRSGISDRLQRLMAEQADNVLHKPFTQTEAAALYRELKALMAEDASRRKAATQFGQGGKIAGMSGGAVTAPPLGAPGKSRAQAALMVTGRKSYTSLEQINDLQRIANDPRQPEDVRDFARSELDAVDRGASITTAHARTIAMLAIPQEEPEPPDELELLAQEALERARQGRKRSPAPAPASNTAPVRYPVRAFTLTWNDLDQWWAHYDPAEVGTALSNEQWEHFESILDATVRFFDAARDARAAHQRLAKESA
jgi:ParB family chromosome partitioning protein